MKKKHLDLFANSCKYRKNQIKEELKVLATFPRTDKKGNSKKSYRNLIISTCFLTVKNAECDNKTKKKTIWRRRWLKTEKWNKSG